eukprot:gene13382-19229_t
MSKTLDCRLWTRPELADIVDEAFLRDSIPDDVVPIPEGVTAMADDAEDADAEDKQPQKLKAAEKEKWSDMAMLMGSTR